MKTKMFGLFALSILTFVFLMSAVSAVTLAEWDFEDTDLIVDSGSGTLVLSDARSATYPAGNAPSPVAAMSSIGWGVADRYIEISINTVNYENLILKFDEQVSGTGPTEFKINYSSDGTTFSELSAIPTSTQSSFGTNPMHTFDFSSITTIDNNINTKLRIIVNASGIASDSVGTFRIDNLLLEATLIPSTEPPEVTDCNNIGNPGNLEVKRIDFTNNGVPYAAFGEDDDQWFPFEEIEVEVKIESDDYDIDDISFEWGIYSLDDNDWLIDLDEEDEFNLKDGDQETFTITFKLDDDLDIDLDEFVDNVDNYRFYVIATGTIDDDNSLDDGEDTCAFRYESSTILIEDFVILDNIDMPETLSCGETVTITADVWNIGDRDQDEVSVSVFGRESALSIGEIIEAGDIDAFDRQQISFTFTVPKNIDEKFYALNFEVNDEDGDVFENNDDDISEFTVPFKVEGNCGAAVEDVIVSATLESEAKAGKEMVIRATIINNGDELQTFSVNAAEFAAWADLISQDQNTLILNKGESRDVLFTFDVKRDASGSQTFFIELTSGDEVTRQSVSVNIEPIRPFLGITGFVTSDNAYLWGIGLLNIILIVIIILIAVRIARRK